MTIRPMQASDLDRVLKIAESLAHAPRWTLPMYETAIRQRNVPPRVALVAEETRSGQVVGFAVASVILPEAELETIGVATDQQRQGIGRQLIEEACRILRGMEVRKVILEVRASNWAAQRLYQSSGFVPTGRRASYYIDPEEDGLIMKRDTREGRLPRVNQGP